MDSMLRTIAPLLLVGLSGTCFAQSSTWSPLGVLVHPAEEIKVPDEIRKAIPADMVVRWMQQTHLSSEGETSLIYDTGDKFEPKPHIAFIRNSVKVDDFGIAEAFHNQVGLLDDFFDNIDLSQVAEIPLQTDFKGLLAAFRNIGDGAATIFVLITETNGTYSVVWHIWTSQAQFRIRSKGSFQVWNSNDGDNCVWCTHHYEVTNYLWNNDKFVKLSHYTTKHELSPFQFSENPIVVKP
jgi:hypothetical protein